MSQPGEKMNLYSVHVKIAGRLVSMGREAETAMAAILDALLTLGVADIQVVDEIEVDLLACK